MGLGDVCCDGSRRTQGRSSLGGLLALALVAFLSFLALPAFALAEGEEELQPTEIESYVDDFGVNEETAEEHLLTQQSGASIVGDLTYAAGDRYAGVWFDNESGEFVVPILASKDQGMVTAALNETEIEPEYAVQTEVVDYSWEELEAAQRRLNGELEAFLEAGLVQTWLDPETNSVVIAEAEGATEVQSNAIATLAEAESVSVQVQEEPVEELVAETEACSFKIMSCDWPMRGGMLMQPAGSTAEPFEQPMCTTAFKAVGRTTGKPFILTAGHCVRATADLSAFAANGQRHYLGHVEAASFPGHDYAAINMLGTYWGGSSPSWVANWGEGQDWPIDYEAWSYMGQQVCHLGIQSGKSCGPVTGLNLSKPADSRGGGIVTLDHLTRFGPMCSVTGDSGGAVFAGHVALGIYSSADPAPKPSEYCSRIGYYTEITENTDALGVNVAPRTGPHSPTAYTEGSEKIGETVATVRARIATGGQDSDYYFEYGPTTSYGSKSSSETVSGLSSIGYRERQLTGLTPFTTYHYRVVASTPYGTSKGEDRQFKTLKKPDVFTLPPTEVTESEAVFNAKVIPYSGAYWEFEYGKTPAYGYVAQWSGGTLPEGTTPTNVSAPVVGLEFGRTYHYRGAASNGAGKGYGENEMVTPGWSGQVALGPESSKVAAFAGTSCVSATSCIAVGSYTDGGGTSLPFTQLWDGASWKSQMAPTASGAQQTDLAGLDCTGASACLAVGSYEVLSGGRKPLIERWDGTEWQVQSAAVPAGAKEARLAGISCVSATDCTAAGFYRSSGGVLLPLIERWDGTEWKLQSVPAPAGAIETRPTSISCVSGTDCTAAGYYENSSNVKVALIERWDGTEWKLQTAQIPGGAKETRLTSISCVSGTDCTTVGYYQSSTGILLPLVERWDGTEWKLQTAPVPAGGIHGLLNGVSCSSTMACITVGTYYQSGGSAPGFRALSERWDGTGWSYQVPPNGTAADLNLLSVSCVSATACMGMGDFSDGSGNTLPVSELYLRTVEPTVFYDMTFGSQGSANGQFYQPSDVALDSKGNLWITDYYNGRVQKFNENGEYLGKFGVYGTGLGKMYFPSAIAIDNSGNFWITELKANRLQKFNEKGEFIKSITGLGEPQGVAVSPAGVVWVANTKGGTVRAYNEAGTLIGWIGGWGSGPGQFLEPTNVDVSSNGHVWVTDYGNNRVQEFTATGEFVRQFGTQGWHAGQLRGPVGIDVDADGRVWVMDRGNKRIQEFNELGEYQAQFGTFGSEAGEFGFHYPAGIVSNSNGRLFVTANAATMSRWTTSP